MSVPTFGSYFFDVVPHMFLKTTSEMVMFDYDPVSIYSHVVPATRTVLTGYWLQSV